MKFPRLLKDPRKRRLVYASLASAAACGLGTYLWASLVEARRYKLEQLQLNTGFAAQNPDQAQNLRILHLSDLHLNEPETHKVEFISRITDADYDLIFITGDIFENYSGMAYADKLITRKPRLGCYAVLGNHDYFNYNMIHRTIGRVIKRWRAPKIKRDVTPMISVLERAGIRVLRNSCQTFTHEKLHIIGIDYPGIAEDRLYELARKASDDHLIIALMHVPDKLERLPAAGVHLAFGGHTHGGQVRIPFWGPIITNSKLPRHEASGLLRRGSTAIHVSRGVSADPRTNFRLFCPPHASVIEVKHA